MTITVHVTSETVLQVNLSVPLVYCADSIKSSLPGPMDSVLKEFDLEREDLDYHCPRNIRDSVAGELISNCVWYFVGRTLKVSDKGLNSICDDHVKQPSCLQIG